MRRWVAAIGIALVLTTSNAQADTDLTSLINAAFVPRIEDAALHDIAHQRALEVVTDWSHNGQRAGTAEVLAQSTGFSDPASFAVTQWQESPAHAAVLSDPTLTHIGCGSVTMDGTYYAACILTAGPVSDPITDGNSSLQTPAPTPIATPPVQVLPDAAMR